MEQSGDVLEPFGEPCLFVVESVEISEGEGLVSARRPPGVVVELEPVVLKSRRDGDGAFAPTRSGAVPVGDLIRLCYSGKYATVDDMMKRAVGDAGIAAYLGTADMREVNKMIENGDENAKLVKEAFIYQHAQNAQLDI